MSSDPTVSADHPVNDAPADQPAEQEPVAAEQGEAASDATKPSPLGRRIQVGSRRPQMLPTPKPIRREPESRSTPAGDAKSASTEDVDEKALEAVADTSTASLPRQGGKVEPPSKRAPLSDDLEREMEAAFAGTNVEQLIADEVVTGEPLEADSRHHATVLRSDDENVFVSLGGPNEAMIPVRQFQDLPEVGSTLEVIVKGFNSDEGLYLAAPPGAAIEVADWSDITEGAVVEARISGSNTGGLECKVNSIPGFIPASQVARFRVEDFAEYIDQRLLCVVTEANPNRRNLVLSHRAYLEREREQQRQQLLESLEVGQMHEGVVRSVRDFGAFVDIGGIDGLVHVSQLSWERIKHPSEVVKEGDKIRVRVEKIDTQSGKIGLSYRDLQDHPWTNAASRFPIGTVITGTVSRLAKFGAFVKLAPGVEGLIHISELSHQRVPNVGSVLKEGQEVQTKILSVDAEAQRIALSLKELQAKPAEEDVAEAEEGEAVREPRTPKYSGPLRGGTERGTGGEQFGLRW